eukprot:GHUV01035464.1.p2 GENE.GHUV01035464.1~~GHUV01035464.1.p2  ORF type:complete len:121 (-),score=47.06 GHUV01035464.1:7-369(-)
MCPVRDPEQLTAAYCHDNGRLAQWQAACVLNCINPLRCLLLQEVESDAEVLAQSAAHMVAREAMALKLAVLGRQMEAKQKRLAALQGAADIEGAKTKYMLELQKERDTLAKEKAELMKVC